MKKLLLLIIVGFVSFSAFSQDIDKYKEEVKQSLDRHIHICDLTEQQKADLSEVLDDKYKEVYEVKQKYQKDKETRKKLIKEISKKYLAQILKVIGEENMEKMNEHRNSQFRDDLNMDVVSINE